MRDRLPDHWSQHDRYGLRVLDPALRTILACCARSGRTETGGILIGRYSEDRRLATVTAASTPSADTRAGNSWLVRGVKGLHAWLQNLWKEDGGYYVGEWHFHPFAAPTPSHQDVSQMKRIAKTESYQCAEPILLVIGGDPSNVWTARVEVHTRSGERHVLSPRPSPIADPQIDLTI